MAREYFSYNAFGTIWVVRVCVCKNTDMYSFTQRKKRRKEGWEEGERARKNILCVV